MTDQGKANYEAYRKASGGVSLISGVQLPGYEDLKPAIRHAWDAAADAVEAWLADAPVDEEAAGAEPAKVIVVTEAGGRERRYAATQWDDGGSRLVILRKGHPVASYPMDGELGVREDGAEVPGDTARALRIAVEGLELITGDQCAGDSATTLRTIGREYLDRIEGL